MSLSRAECLHESTARFCPRDKVDAAQDNHLHPAPRAVLSAGMSAKHRTMRCSMLFFRFIFCVREKVQVFYLRNPGRIACIEDARNTIMALAIAIQPFERY